MLPLTATTKLPVRPPRSRSLRREMMGNLASESFQAFACARARACTLHCIYNVDCHPTPKLRADVRARARALAVCTFRFCYRGKSLLLNYYTTDELLQTKSFNLIFHNTFLCVCLCVWLRLCAHNTRGYAFPRSTLASTGGMVDWQAGRRVLCGRPYWRACDAIIFA